MIIDCHTHLASSKLFPQSFMNGISENLFSAAGNIRKEQKVILTSMLESTIIGDDLGKKHIKEMEEAGIDQSVLLIIDYNYIFPDEQASIEELFRIHHELLMAYPEKFIVFAGIDPRRGREGLELFERSLKEWNFKGLKLYPPCGFYPSDPILFPYYEIAASYHVPVLLHTGPTSPTMPFKYSAPHLIDDAAYNFPNVNFILAHAAFMMHEEASILAEYRPNVYLDVSGFSQAIKQESFDSIMLGHKKRGILHKILFGTDWPIFRLNSSQKELLKTFTERCEKILSTKEMDNIMGNTFAKLIQ